MNGNHMKRSPKDIANLMAEAAQKKVRAAQTPKTTETDTEIADLPMSKRKKATPGKDKAGK